MTRTPASPPTPSVPPHLCRDHLHVPIRSGGRRLLAPILAGALLITACSDDSTGPSRDDVEVTGLEVLQGNSGDLLARTHGTGPGIHWHGHIHLRPGESTALDLRFLDAGGSPIALGGDLTVDARLAPGSSTGLVTVEPHGDHVDVDALAEGVVGVLFSLRSGTSVVWEAPVLEVEVEEEQEGPSPSAVVSLRLDHRDGSGHVSHTHGTGAGMEWHGDLHLHPGDTVEVDITFRNAAGDTLRFFEGDEYTLGAALAPGSAPGVVSVDVHGDHLQVIALGEGEVLLVLSIDHGDHSDFESPPLRVEVEDRHSDPGVGTVASIRLMDRESGGESGVTTQGTTSTSRFSLRAGSRW